MTTTSPTRNKEDISPAEKSEAFDGAGPDPIEPRLQPELRNQAGSERPLHRKYGILPETVKAGGNWKKLEITNVAAALRAGRGCQAGPSGFVWKRPESVNFDYSEEVLERWRNN